MLRVGGGGGGGRGGCGGGQKGAVSSRHLPAAQVPLPVTVSAVTVGAAVSVRGEKKSRQARTRFIWQGRFDRTV